MHPEDDDSLRSLLAGGRLSGAQRQSILANVLQARAAPEPRPRLWAGAAVVCATAAAFALLLIPPSPSPRSKVSESVPVQTLVAKGAAGVAFQVACEEGMAGTCRQGDRLVIETHGAKQGYLAAYAEGPGGRIWYFPARDGHMPTVSESAGVQIAPEAVRIGVEHVPGVYTLHVSLFETAVSREQLLAEATRPLAKAKLKFEVTR